MSEEIKSRLDAFVSKMTQKIEKKEVMPEIQQEYDELIEFLDKFSFLKNEEFEALENAMSKYDLSLKKYEDQIKSYDAQKKIDDEKLMVNSNDKNNKKNYKILKLNTENCEKNLQKNLFNFIFI